MTPLHRFLAGAAILATLLPYPVNATLGITDVPLDELLFSDTTLFAQACPDLSAELLTAQAIATPAKIDSIQRDDGTIIAVQVGNAILDLAVPEETAIYVMTDFIENGGWLVVMPLTPEDMEAARDYTPAPVGKMALVGITNSFNGEPQTCLQFTEFHAVYPEGLELFPAEVSKALSNSRQASN